MIRNDTREEKCRNQDIVPPIILSHLATLAKVESIANLTSGTAGWETSSDSFEASGFKGVFPISNEPRDRNEYTALLGRLLVSPQSTIGAAYET
jgi:hypothetical protein